MCPAIHLRKTNVWSAGFPGGPGFFVCVEFYFECKKMCENWMKILKENWIMRVAFAASLFAVCLCFSSLSESSILSCISLWIDKSVVFTSRTFSTKYESRRLHLG